jgi:hypothetical protein
MDNPETLATLGTQDTRRRQTKQKTQRNMKRTRDLARGITDCRKVQEGK